MYSGSASLAGVAITAMLVQLISSSTCEASPNAQPMGGPAWTLIWGDEFDGASNTGVSTDNWLYDSGTSYPGGPPNWGTGEVESMSADTANVHQDGAGHLVITPIHTGSAAATGWTSGRIETQRTDFQPPAGGALAVEASIQQPNVSGTAAAGYWPAFWMLGAPFRGNYGNWPSIDEIDIMEDVNGRSSEFGTLHCGTGNAPNPCNELTGLSSGEIPCPGCQTAFHSYRVELDKSISPEEIRWYLDGVNFFTVRSNQVDQTTWEDATTHGFFIILNVAVGGSFPAAFGDGPTTATASGAPMLADYVRVYVRAPNPTPAATVTPGSCAGDCDGGGTVTVDELLTGVNIALGVRSPSDCESFDSDRSGTVTIDELLTAVNNALFGCRATPTHTPYP